VDHCLITTATTECNVAYDRLKNSNETCFVLPHSCTVLYGSTSKPCVVCFCRTELCVRLGWSCETGAEMKRLAGGSIGCACSVAVLTGLWYFSKECECIRVSQKTCLYFSRGCTGVCDKRCVPLYPSACGRKPPASFCVQLRDRCEGLLVLKIF